MSNDDHNMITGNSLGAHSAQVCESRNCRTRTDWLLLGPFTSDLLRRLGFTHSAYDEWSLPRFLKFLQTDPNSVAADLNIATVHWLTRTVENALRASVYAVFPNSTLVHTTKPVDSRLKLRPVEFECVCGLLEAAGAKCPITCSCKNSPPCFKGLKQIFIAAKRTCGLKGHPVICKCVKHT